MLKAYEIIKAGAERSMKLLFGRLEGRYTHRDQSGITNCPKTGPFPQQVINVWNSLPQAVLKEQ